MTALRVAFVAAILVPVAHVATLLLAGQDGVSTPISALSRSPWGALHTAGLLSFALAHVALAVGMGPSGPGRLWQAARVLLLAAAVLLCHVAWYFATASEETLYGPGANDPLSVLASVVGVAMGAVQPGLRRRSRRLAAFNALCLAAWLLLVPVILLVEASWLGAYERVVGSVYALWILGLAIGLGCARPFSGGNADAAGADRAGGSPRAGR